MIPFNFSYARPSSIKEAVLLWDEFDKKGKAPVYYAGGTEIITFGREMKTAPGLVIDIKAIKACLEFRQDAVIAYGAALPLNTVAERTASGLVRDAVSAIADHTIRNRLTLGGNIAGRLPFKEALLPFLVLGGIARISGPRGRRTMKLDAGFDKRLRLRKGELITGFTLDPGKINDPWFYARKQKDSPVDYPILTACFSGKPGRIRMAVSGAFSFPLRDKKTEMILNTAGLSPGERAKKAVDGLSLLFKSDFRASSRYRQHLMRQTIENALYRLETP